MLLVDLPSSYAIEVQAPRRRVCAIAKSAAAALSGYRVLYRFERAEITFSDLPAPDDDEIRSNAFWRAAFGIDRPAPIPQARRSAKPPKCGVKGPEATPSGVFLTFYRPLISRDGRHALITIAAGLGVREHLPGVASAQRFPTYVCKLDKVSGQWVTRSCANAAERLF